jgi:hypothetical protein
MEMEEDDKKEKPTRGVSIVSNDGGKKKKT